MQNISIHEPVGLLIGVIILTIITSTIFILVLRNKEFKSRSFLERQIILWSLYILTGSQLLARLILIYSLLLDIFRKRSLDQSNNT